jgi:nitrogen fixation protein FixH
MNWGHKIAFVYGGFVLFIAGMITICVKQKDIFLVSPDYYKEEIAYQDQINRLTNAVHEPIGFRYAGAEGEVKLSLPASHAGARGEILFFRPADARKDAKVPLELGADGKQTVPVRRLEQGLWKVKIRWTSGGKEYFSEQVLVI